MNVNRRTALSFAGVAGLALVAPAAAADDPAIEPNNALAQQFVDSALNAGNAAGVDPLLSPDVVGADEDDAPGVDAYKKRLDIWLRSATVTADHVNFSADTIIAEADRVVVRGYITGVARSGKRIQATYFVELAVKGGKIVGTWLAQDFSALVEL